MNYEELKASFTLLNECNEDLNKKMLLKEENEKRLRELGQRCAELEAQYDEMVEKKVLGEISDNDLKTFKAKFDEVSKELSKAKEEQEIIDRLLEKPLYGEDAIRQAFHEFQNHFYETEVFSIQEKMKKAKDAYMKAFDEYKDAINNMDRIRVDTQGYMRRFNMNDWLNRMSRNEKGIFVDPDHLKETDFIYQG